MSDQSVKVGDIVFAADLVKVQKATKYFNITYYDLDSINATQKHRAHKAFQLLSTDYDGFQYWNIDDVSVENNALIEEGLTADTSAYMRADNQFVVTYYNYGTKPDYVQTEQKSTYNTCTNSIYLSNCNGQVNVLRTDYSYDLTSNSFQLSTYRFTGWKKNDYGDLLQPGTSQTLQTNTDYYAQWIRQYWLQLRSNDTRKGQTILTNHSYSSTAGLYKNTYDKNSTMTISACPAEHYHFVKHAISYVDVNGNTPPITSLVVTTLNNGKYSCVLSNNIDITSTYSIDRYNISFNVNTNNAGTVKITANSSSYTNNTTAIKTIQQDWNTRCYFEATRSSRTYKFLRWNGNVPSQYAYNAIFTTALTNDITATALFETATTYSVLVYANNKFGTVSTNKDPETPELPDGVYVQPDAGKTFDVIITATPNDKCKFLYWKDTSGKTYTSTAVTLTHFIDQNYQLTAYFDALLVDQDDTPLIFDDGEQIDYSDSGWTT